MTEQELREKIVDIIKNKTKEPIIINGVHLDDINMPKSIMYNIADALIAERIGDVSEYKHRAEVAEDELARHKRALRIAGDKFINEVCNMRGEDISDKCDYKCDTCFYDYYLQQAEKELSEERKDEQS